ncbi:MAG: HNH endonuclease [Bacteroidota bacterium]
MSGNIIPVNMAKRKSISKKTRFEVFKRDKFTCQYCGLKAPDIILHIDHIDPVAGGGSNNLINLTTSCVDCNSGKSHRRLDDNSVVEKQRRQLELLQEKREQVELMVEWKKSLEKFDNDINEIISDYINSKIKPLCINENGKKSIAEWLKKFNTEKILDGIDEAAKYLKYDDDGGIDKKSAEHFISKIPGVIFVKQMPPIKRKLAYIKGIARNRFEYWDDRIGAIILNNYVQALKDYGWDDAQILSDLENEVMSRTKDSENWNQWKSLIEKWTDDINKWEKEDSISNRRNNFYDNCEVSLDTLERGAHYEQCCADDKIEALIHIGSAFPNFNSKTFKEEAIETILVFIYKIEQLYKASPGKEVDEEQNFVCNFAENCSLNQYFNPPDSAFNYGVLLLLSEKCQGIIEDMLTEFYLPRTLYKRNDIDSLIKIHLQHYEEQSVI